MFTKIDQHSPGVSLAAVTGDTVDNVLAPPRVDFCVDDTSEGYIVADIIVSTVTGVTVDNVLAPPRVNFCVDDTSEGYIVADIITVSTVTGDTVGNALVPPTVSFCVDEISEGFIVADIITVSVSGKLVNIGRSWLESDKMAWILHTVVWEIFGVKMFSYAYYQVWKLNTWNIFSTIYGTRKIFICHPSVWKFSTQNFYIWKFFDSKFSKLWCTQTHEHTYTYTSNQPHNTCI